MAYKSFPIYDYKSGLVLEKQPWLIPKDALQTLRNAYIAQGVLKKRKGYELWGRMIHVVTEEPLGTTVDLTLTYSGTLLHAPLRNRVGDMNLTIFTSGDPETFTDNGDGTLSGTEGGYGTINYATGAWQVTYGANPGNGRQITAAYYWHPDSRIMGIYNFYRQDGSSQLLFFNMVRANRYDVANDKLVIVEHSTKGIGDVWTGSTSDFFWTENWKDRLFIVNNKDQIQVYDGTNLADFVIDYTGGTTNKVNTCLMIFAYKGRLIILNSTEEGASYPQRARWSAAGTYEDWNEATGGGYNDADTLDRIVTADYIGDDLIVFFERSVWALKYTGDSYLPFRWEQVAGTEGAYATFSVIPFSDELIALGPVRFVGTDGLNTYTVDDKIPDYALTVDQQKLSFVYGAVLEEIRQAWWLYPPPGADISKEALVLQYEDNSWSVFDTPFSCLGYWEELVTYTWETINKTWEEIGITWNELNQFSAGYPMTLGGGKTGEIYILNRGGTDDGASISLDIQYGWWNPFIEQAQKARLGWVDLFVTQNPDAYVTIEFYMNHESTPYRTETISLKGLAGAEKVWVRVYANAVADSHSLRIHHASVNQPVEIHAVVPHFKPAGPIR
jgi:hypothetical protein